MTFEREGAKLLVRLDERIDSVNAGETEEAIMNAVAKQPTDSVELQAKELRMISSAGLRILLKLTKQGLSVCVTDVRPEIYEVFEVTGFTGLVKVHKALRTVSVKEAALIGRGGTAAVYRLNEDTILKLYNDNVDFATIEKEKIYTRKAFELGMPCAISYDIVECEGKYGIVYEMIRSHTLAEVMSSDTEHLESYAAEYAKLGRLIHGLSADPEVYPRTVQLYHDEIDLLASYLTKEETERLHEFIDRVPERKTLIHGDFHLNNVMLQDGEYLLIDLADVSWGHPVYELACTYVSLVSICSRGADFTKQMYGLLPEELMRVWNQFVKSYFDTTEEERLKEIDKMLEPFALLKNVLRLVSSGPVPEAMLPMLLGMVRAKLLPAIAEADMEMLNRYFGT